MAKKSIKGLVETFYQTMFFRLELIYGGAFMYWWQEKGRKSFFRWAKKDGVEFVENELFDEPKYKRL